MDKNTVINRLVKLAQLDIDAVYAYEQALKNIDRSDVYKNINEFRQDHLRHIDNLSLLIRSYGGTPPERTQDLKGYLIEGMTMIRSLTGTSGALAGMKTNEELTNKIYREALEESENDKMPADVVEIIEENYEDEKRHLRYIKETLEVEA